MADKVPVVLIIFKRLYTMERIIERVRTYSPEKVYILADGGRNDDEHIECEKCRREVEQLINWDCEIVRRYADHNIGVYQNIGEGAKWVFQREKKAIFLEDDNLPEYTFFDYCEQLLDRYENNDKVLWICGTNYLEKFDSKYSYMFTQHMLPCGWASWSEKFLRYYDGELADISSNMKRFKKSYWIGSHFYFSLFQNRKASVERTRYLIETNKQRASWDYQMCYSVRSNDLVGVSPCVNQIKNIGVDEYSIHGGTKMTRALEKYCGMNTQIMEFPLRHPESVELDVSYEKKVAKWLSPSFIVTIIRFGPVLWAKNILGIRKYDSLKEKIKNSSNSRTKYTK